MKTLVLSIALALLSPACKERDHYYYPPFVVQNFMNQCVTSGSSQEVCSCALERVQRKFSLEEYNLMEMKTVGEKAPPDEFLRTISACRTQAAK
jgi:hypothetical protein